MLNKVRKNKFNLVYEQILSDFSQNIPTSDPLSSDFDEETEILMKKYNLTESDLRFSCAYKDDNFSYER